MSHKTLSNHYQSSQTLIKLGVTLSILSAVGLAIWGWILQQPGILPSPDSKAGKALLSQYLGTTHDAWLILLAFTLGYLIIRISKNRRKEALNNKETFKRPLESTIRFIRQNPIATILFIAYAVAMISGTTYLYKDMVGWYEDLVQDHLLNNFSIRGAFVSETMRRSDYRFFPLAHQDLHILSWFSIQIKTWILLSAAELIAIVLLSVKFLNGLHPGKPAQHSTLLLISALLLIHPSTGTAFFHVIYSERLLCLVFMLFITSYLEYRNHRRLSTFYLTFLWALIGIYIKDIAILLFVIPPAFLWILDSKEITSNQQEQRENRTSKHRNQLEKWLCSLILVFITSYIFLALIPSSYAAEGAYNDDAPYLLILDLRFYIFSLIILARAITILSGRAQFNLLDAINISAISYAAALALTYEFNANNYLALPVQLIATINIGWAWIWMVEKKNYKYLTKNIKLILSISLSALIISLDHITTDETFAYTISRLKMEQSITQETYEKLYEVSRDIRESGDDVNIIINESSRLSADRHLDRIHYKSLIEYKEIDGNGLFIIGDGAGKGDIYSPKAGDLIVNLDKKIDLLTPLVQNVKTKLVYKHKPSDGTGIILRISKVY